MSDALDDQCFVVHCMGVFRQSWLFQLGIEIRCRLLSEKGPPNQMILMTAPERESSGARCKVLHVPIVIPPRTARMGCWGASQALNPGQNIINSAFEYRPM